ncbi:MAG: helix-turn-helix transcriptional regulator, partial [Phormidesmis sp. CAN_BIN36]|nr:helix-turn-helix transcriptional regulator [Phormidesmis sp. CAN_BIN36]
MASFVVLFVRYISLTHPTRSAIALKVLQQMTAEDPEMEEMIKEASLNAELAQLLYQARTQAGLTQQQLADRIGTKQSVIARLEDAEYEGHSLSMLQK